MPHALKVDRQLIDYISKQIEGLEYGTVHIVVHDGRVVQIERTERSRLDSPKSKRTSS
jgi:hypothetical protein